MSNPQLELFQEFERLLPPKWFRQLRQSEGPLYPLVWGLCGAMADLRSSIEAVRQQSIPLDSDGFWLSLHLLGLGIQRTTETDDQAHDRYRLEFEPTRNTRAGLFRYIQALSGLPEGAIAIETDFELKRYGSLRISLSDTGRSYRDVGWAWVDRLLNEHVANGVQPVVSIALQDLLGTPLPPWRFDHPFPMGQGQLGPLWERPAFSDSLRLLELSCNHFAFLCVEQWELLPLDRIFRDTHSGGKPGAQYAYLVEPCGGRCYEVDYQPENLDVEELQYGARPFRVEGFQFDDVFPREGAQSVIETVDIDIRIYGLAPTESNIFPGEASGFPAFGSPNGTAYSLPLPDEWQLLSVEDTFSHQSIPSNWQVGSYSFEQLRRFPYDQRFETGQETVNRNIPDTTLVDFEMLGGATASTFEAWRKRGNYREINRYSEGDHILPIASDWDLLLPLLDTESQSHSLVEKLPQVADHYGFEQFSFACNADKSVLVLEKQSPEATIGYIPNVRAGFTRKNIIEWLEVVATVEELQTPNSLIQMGHGPWTLRLGSGNPSWGDTVPPGIAPLQGEFALLQPSSQWWTDGNNTVRSTSPLIDANGVAYLAIEFLLPRGSRRLLRELELRIGYEQPTFTYTEGWVIPSAEQWEIQPASTISIPTFDDATEVLNLQTPVLDVVHFRRMNLTISEDVNWGVVFCIATRLRDVQTQLLPAFRTGQSRTGEVLRDRDYIYAI